MSRQKLIDRLHAQIDVNGHILGAAVGSGITAKYAEQGGADLLIALSAGKFRIMGRSSYASYFCYGSSNDIVMDLGIHELLPVVKETPVIFGLFASDPSISLYEIQSLLQSAANQTILRILLHIVLKQVFHSM